MLDTMKLVLDKSMFRLLDKNRFYSDTTNEMRGYSTFVQNPTKAELSKGVYKPRLTLTNRFNCSKRSEDTLTVELSVPKLLFGNNFDELNESDFDLVVSTLNQRLK